MSLSLPHLLKSGAPVTPEDIERYYELGYWADRTIRSVLSEVAAMHPDRDALVGYRSDGAIVRWSYNDLDQRANHVASVLAEMGVVPGDCVAVMLPNWIEYGALIFGINELGAVYTGIPVA